MWLTIKYLHIYSIIFLYLGIALPGLAKDIELYCYFKNYSADSKRILQIILDAKNEEPIIVNAEFDQTLYEYIIGKDSYQLFFQHCSELEPTLLLVDLKGISNRKSFGSHIYSVGPKQLQLKTNQVEKIKKLLSGVIGSERRWKKLYKNGLNETIEAVKGYFDSNNLDATHNFRKLSAIYAALPKVQESVVDENPELDSVRSYFSSISDSKTESNPFITTQVKADFTRIELNIFANGQSLYRSKNFDKGSKLLIEVPFEILEQFYSERIAVSLLDLRKNIALALHTRTQGFDNQSVALVDHFFSYGNNMDFSIGNTTPTSHRLKLYQNSIHMSTQSELQLSVPDYKADKGKIIGKFVVRRYMNFDMVSGRCSEQHVTIEKFPK